MPATAIELLMLQSQETPVHYRLPRHFFVLALLSLLLPLLAACGSAPVASQPTSPPVIPTAIVDIGNSGSGAATPANPSTQPTAPVIQPTDAAPQPTTAPVQPTTAVASGPLRTPYLEFGIVPHLYYTDRERVLTLTNNAGFDWIRQQIQWQYLEGPNPKNYAWDPELDAIIDAAARYNLKLLISITRAPDFYNPTNGLPANPDDMGDFVEALVQRYGNKITAIEIWNEQNLAHETGGTITLEQAGQYVEILAESYKRIKALQPQIYVLAGAPSSTGVTDVNIAIDDLTYYRAMYEYNDGMIKDYFDVQAVHPGGSANPPETLWPENPGRVEGCERAIPGSTADNCWNTHPTFYFRHLENVHAVMQEYGLGERQIWVTEFGWATANNTPGYEFGNLVSFEQQAEYISNAIRYTYENYPWVGVLFLWNMNFAVLWGQEGNPLHEQAAFGILNPDWSPRPSYLAVQSLIAELKTREGR